MRIHTASLFVFLLAFVGCSTTPLPEGAEKPPEHARRVQVAIYDSTSRPKSTHLDVYDRQLPQRPYKEIALLTCEGEPQEEAAMTTATLYRARMLGADAVMSAGTAVTQKGGGLIITPRGGFSGGVDTRCVFRAKAIVYEVK